MWNNLGALETVKVISRLAKAGDRQGRMSVEAG